ncbi:MAG: hypothetical protein CMM84_03810 [Rhodothermaceae bacterium]|nr:hypothetical protein [Rhodothermaceae bacterium]MBC15343.1 hypothetical protein [Rhodothermaceae bacterium]
MDPNETPPLYDPVAMDGDLSLIEPAGLSDPDLAALLIDLAAERDRSEDRDSLLRDSLRQWGRRTFGTVDAYYVELHTRTGYTVGHIANAHTSAKSAAVLDAAVALYREVTGSDGGDDPAPVVVGRIGGPPVHRPPLRAAA